MDEKKGWNETDNIVAKILRGENRFYEEVSITSVTGECPYGHKEGDTFRVTALSTVMVSVDPSTKLLMPP